jgi:Fibronectin type III domain
MWRPNWKRASWSMILIIASMQLTGCSGSTHTQAARSAGPSGVLTVSWNPPARNTNGTPLTDLTGYTIHYGRAPGNYTGVVRIDDPAATHYVIGGLRSGRWYFAVSANNSSGEHSALSAEATATVQ